MGLDIVAELLDLEPWKLIVETLDFLQAERIGGDLLQIVEKVGQPLADGVDIPGGDAQAHGLLGWRTSAACHAGAKKRRAAAIWGSTSSGDDWNAGEPRKPRLRRSEWVRST